jgi:hypothetical protein
LASAPPAFALSVSTGGGSKTGGGVLKKDPAGEEAPCRGAIGVPGGVARHANQPRPAQIVPGSARLDLAAVEARLTAAYASLAAERAALVEATVRLGERYPALKNDTTAPGVRLPALIRRRPVPVNT